MASISQFKVQKKGKRAEENTVTASRDVCKHQVVNICPVLLYFGVVREAMVLSSG